MKRKHRDYQVKCQQEIYAGFAKGLTRGIVVAPTGAGKTWIASMVVYDYVRRLNKRVLFVVHRDALINQTVDTMAFWGITPGVVAGSYPEDRSRLMQIASFQTLTPDETERSRRDLSRLLAWFKPDLVVFDECHVLNYSSVALELTPKLRAIKEIENYKDPWLSLGLTATPFRLNRHESLGDIYQFMVCAPMPAKLIEDKVLVPIIYYDVPNAGSGKIDVRISYIVENWLKKGQYSKTIAFCPSVAFAKSLAAAFEAVGVKAAIVHGGTGTIKRNDIYKDFKSEKPDSTLVLCSCMALCLDSETEILTDQGWVDCDNISYSHKVANWDNGEVFFEEPKNIIKRVREPHESMVTFKSESINLRVTEGHQMVTYNHFRQKFEKREAIALVDLDSVTIPMFEHTLLTPRLAEVQPSIESEPWKIESVWCVTSTSGNIIVRRKGKATVVGNCEGFDATIARCGIFARDTDSPALAIQMLGRIVRSHTYEDGTVKTDAIAFDCVGMYGIKFPYFEDIQITEASLYEGTVRVPGDAPRKKCPVKYGGCGAHVMVGLGFCPRCGFEFTIHSQPRIDPGGDMRQVIRSEQEKLIFYRKWLKIAFDKDKPPSWADAKYFTRFKCYPLDGWKLNAIYTNPTPEQRSKVKAYFRRHSFLSGDPYRWEAKQLSLEFGHDSDRNIEEFDPRSLSDYEVDTERKLLVRKSDIAIAETLQRLRELRQEGISVSASRESLDSQVR